MRVLILHSRYQSGSVSGENRVVDDEAILLREGGHDVRVLSPSVEGSGIKAQARAAGSTVWARSVARAVRDLVHNFRPHVVHCHNLFPTLSPAVLRAAGSGPRVVMTLHNFRLMCLPGNLYRDGEVCELCVGRVPWRGVQYGCYRGSVSASAALASSLSVHRALRSFDRVDRFLPVSRFVRDKHVEAGFDPARFVVKPNFSWPSHRREGPGEHFLFLGRIAPEKGLDVLIRAWHGVEARLLVVGDGPDHEKLAASAPSNVTFTGAVSAHDVPAMLGRARALVVPSQWYEPAPRGIVEAYAAGVPVIGSRAGGIPELVEEERSGLLVAPRSTEGWRAAAERLSDDGEAVRLGDGAAGLWKERYGPDGALDALEAAYSAM